VIIKDRLSAQKNRLATFVGPDAMQMIVDEAMQAAHGDLAQVEQGLDANIRWWEQQEEGRPADQSDKRDTSTPESRERAKRNYERSKARVAWKKKLKGEPDRTIYPYGGFFLMTRVIDNQVRVAMSKTVLLAFIECLDEADICGQFEMPAGALGQRIGCNRRNAQNALYTLLKAGVIRILHEGGTTVPNVYSLVPGHQFNKEQAIAALTETRKATRKRLSQEISLVATATLEVVA